jgi:3-oxoacyl-[acyl-carrier-protein] synthase-1
VTFAITGVAIANCLGADAAAVADAAFAGDAGLVPGDAYAALPFATALGVIAGAEALPSELACAPTRIARIAAASVRALAPAVQAAVARWGAPRVAYVFASSTGGIEETERELVPDARLPLLAPPYRYANHLIDATSAAIAAHLGIAGVQLAISTACSSSLKAVATATRLIAHGLADAVVVGGVDSLCRTTIFGFHSLGLLAPGPTRPFSRERAGISLGEGSAYVVLERPTAETRRAALAYVTGVGVATDSYHHTTPHPEGLGPQLCMREALAGAGRAPADIGYVSAHGTGTPHNDAAEAVAVRKVFERDVPLTATKSLTGHTLGAAGLTALILGVESLRRQAIPPSVGAAPVDAQLGVAVVDMPTRARFAHVLVNAFGFGGSCASVVIAEAA